METPAASNATPLGKVSLPRLVPASLRQPVRWTVLVVLALVAAGCVTPTGAGDEHGDHGSADAGDSPLLDTGTIAPGAEATLTFDTPGELVVHCHPHPWMVQNVTVTEDAPSNVHAHILDGDTAEEYRFEPAELRIGRGSTVTYHNHGRFAHTATEH